MHNSADVVVKYKQILSGDQVLSDYFGYLRKGFSSLSQISHMEIDEIGLLVQKRCQEMFALNAFVELLPFKDSVSPYIEFVDTLFIKETNMLCQVCFGGDLLAQNTDRLNYIDSLSRFSILNIGICWMLGTAGISNVCNTKHNSLTWC